MRHLGQRLTLNDLIADVGHDNLALVDLVDQEFSDLILCSLVKLEISLDNYHVSVHADPTLTYLLHKKDHIRGSFDLHTSPLLRSQAMTFLLEGEVQ